MTKLIWALTPLVAAFWLVLFIAHPLLHGTPLDGGWLDAVLNNGPLWLHAYGGRR